LVAVAVGIYFPALYGRLHIIAPGLFLLALSAGGILPVRRITLYLDVIEIRSFFGRQLVPYSDIVSWSRRGFEWVVELRDGHTVSLGAGPKAAEAIDLLGRTWVGARPPWLARSSESFRDLAVDVDEARVLLRSRGLAAEERQRVAELVAKDYVEEVEEAEQSCAKPLVGRGRE
jgi:hypothetical protein